MKKRVWAALLTLLLCAGLPTAVLAQEALPQDAPAEDILSQTSPAQPVDLAVFQEKLAAFKAERYGHGSTYIDDPATTGGYQCFGFANELALYIFGSFPSRFMAGTPVTAGWTVTYGGDAVDSLCVGDVVRYEYHSIFITDIQDDTVYFCQANAPAGTNRVTYDNTVSRGTLKARVANDLTIGDTGKTGWVAHFDASGITPVPALTLRYHANGGTPPPAQLLGTTYRVTTSVGLNVRPQPTTGAARLGVLPQGSVVTVTETHQASDYLWGKIDYQGQVGWIALDASWIQETGTLWSSDWTVDSSGLLCRRSTGAVYEERYLYGVPADSPADFALTKTGCSFAGWALAPDGEVCLVPGVAFTPEQLFPALADGSTALTLYAAWMPEASFAPTITGSAIDSGCAVLHAPAAGWLAGENTFAVTSPQPCAAAISSDGGQTYTRLTAVDSDGTGARFTAAIGPDTIIAVVVQGDTNGDGRLSVADIARLKAVQLGKTPDDPLTALAGDTTHDGRLSVADIARLKAVQLGKASFIW